MAAVMVLQCVCCDTLGNPKGNDSQSITMTVTVENFSAKADIEIMEFSVTHKEVLYGRSVTLTLDSSAAYSGTIQNVPTGPIDFQVRILGMASRPLCNLTGTCIVSSRSPVVISQQLSDLSCGIPKPPQ
jgi:hypothetical protein